MKKVLQPWGQAWGVWCPSSQCVILDQVVGDSNPTGTVLHVFEQDWLLHRK